MGFPLRDKITGGYPVKENRTCISDKKQITYILTQNGIAIPVHFKFFRVQAYVHKKYMNFIMAYNNFLVKIIYSCDLCYLFANTLNFT